MRGGPMVDPRELLVETRRELARFAELLPMLVAGLEGAAWRARPRPAEWSPVEIVCSPPRRGGRRLRRAPARHLGGGRTLRSARRHRRASQRRPALRPRSPGELGRARPPAPPAARGHAGAALGHSLGAARRGLRRADSLPRLGARYFRALAMWAGCGNASPASSRWAASVSVISVTSSRRCASVSCARGPSIWGAPPVTIR